MSRFVRYLRYTLTLRAPAIVTTLSGDPNSSKTQRFIPGGALRGVLAGELLHKGVSADSDDFRRLILEGDVRFLHAYLAIGSVRSLPVPIPWRKVKGVENATAFDLATYTGLIDADTEFIASDDDELRIEPIETWATKSLRKPEVSFIEFSGTTGGVKVRTDSRSHQQRDRLKGCSWKTIHDDGSEEPHGALFAYEFLEPEQTFQGMIQVLGDSDDETKALIKQIREILDQRPIFIGRSRRAGYGGAATIEFGSIEQHEGHWGDVQTDEVSAGSLFRVYLLSACLTRDPGTGQFDPGALSRRLVHQLGGEDVVRIERTLWDFETIGGFNRKWQLEVPQALAVKAGSVLVLRAKQAVPATTLREVEHHGIGERRIEGFGRLKFLRHRDDLLTVSVAPAEPKDRTTLQPPSEPSELVEFLQRRLLDAAFSRSLDRKVRAIVGDLRNTKIPTGSLLGRLRIPLRNGDPAAGLQTLQQWLDDRDSNSRTVLKEQAQKKLHECLLANAMSLRKWLIQTATSEAGAQSATSDAVLQRKNQLGVDDRLARSTAVTQGAEYGLRLIDAVLATLARRVRQEGATPS